MRDREKKKKKKKRTKNARQGQDIGDEERDGAAMSFIQQPDCYGDEASAIPSGNHDSAIKDAQNVLLSGGGGQTGDSDVETESESDGGDSNDACIVESDGESYEETLLYIDLDKAKSVLSLSSDEDEQSQDEEKNFEAEICEDEAGPVHVWRATKKVTLYLSGTKRVVRFINDAFSPEISISPISTFLNKHGRVYVYKYASEDNPDAAAAESCHGYPFDVQGENAVEVAKWFLHPEHPERRTAFGDYNFRQWNCEHFSTFCHTTCLSVADLDLKFQSCVTQRASLEAEPGLSGSESSKRARLTTIRRQRQLGEDFKVFLKAESRAVSLQADEMERKNILEKGFLSMRVSKSEGKLIDKVKKKQATTEAGEFSPESEEDARREERPVPKMPPPAREFCGDESGSLVSKKRGSSEDCDMPPAKLAKY